MHRFRRIVLPACRLSCVFGLVACASLDATAQGTSPVTVVVDLGGPRREVHPEIYGVSFGDDAQHADLRYPIRRWGGNATSRYNYQSDVDNRGADWYFQHIVSGDGSNLPDDSTANRFIDATRAGGGATLLTVPTIGWVARDSRVKAWGFSIEKYGPQTDNECIATGFPPWCSADSGNGRCNTAAANCVGGNIVGNDPLDTSKPAAPAHAGGWVTHLRARHGPANAGGVRHFALDNEPMLWHHTHRDVHPQPPTYDEIWTRGRERAEAIKAVEPDAVVFGPVTWGWCDFWSSASDASQPTNNCFDGPDRQAHGGAGFVAWYLAQICAHPRPGGGRLVDVLDLHYYPQGIDAFGEGDADQQARRLRSLRELHDATWESESWIGDTGYPIPMLLPRARQLIDTHCPGTGLALTEYSWGGDTGLTSALAQAEALAIFGREGVDYAMRWTAPAVGSLVEDAFRMYLDIDGNNTRVVGDSVAASTSAPHEVNAYAVDRDATTLYVLLFNHTTQAREVTVQVPAATLASYRRHRLDAGGFAPVGGVVAATGSAVVLASVPARSAELLVIAKGDVVDPADAVFEDGFEAP